MDKLILFDIDRTLLNTQKFKTLYQQSILESIRVKKKDFLVTQSKYLSSLESSTDFDHKSYINFLGKNLKVSVKVIKRAFLKRNLFVRSLFPECVSVLAKLHKRHKLGVFSEGVRDYQILKIKMSGIYNFFDPKQIFIFRRKLETKNLQKLPKEVFIVDDKEEVIKALLSYGGFEPVWLNLKSDRKLSGVLTVRTLRDLLNYLKRPKGTGDF